MKQIKTLLIAAMVVLGANTMNAQAKVAHVNVAEIMTKMPAMLDAQKQLEKLSTTYDAEYKKMVTEYQDLLKKYDAEAKTVTDAVNETRGKEVQDMQQRIVAYRDNAQKELQQKESDITKPLYEKVRTSIQKIGKAKGMQYILDAASLLLADGPDLTADVKKDLGF
ncbi:Outer membrane protein H precursor [Flavobacterium sp. 9R]|jgi:outer membrane protein|uniref:OmpH family outer membrane protein n=1 Tax=unclassified Flavobacterium TaxID=196869 RepID=UPI0012F23EF2|nr:OmpH family outer membrane protein [Flavobacterium sp. 9R]MBP7396158.1 OmpH family outer membrane protein [Flavobacterium sp.]TAF74066.1 MAG: OmpH family outer membrane protein [Flavobacterium sp.]VXB45933.1 Outer membrane protein H precursor [Flavobacterium sp. 9R]